ncbi:NAD(P)-dependent dehydrogenase (short-subunit alcohol dehydrogenase family) [Povalibacter uvarum]|uniref:NAD(P)-dependent dehydrogenase (Short-subunit alcohol dehydrogenase family) n=1 Tax=Povalibacter uvarum TaxID=732238 RepID=A0A841HHQ0_9GAMM|nr:YciK family oxidoreductase [Povalibacter uvarum]MBB6091929.1 NAD(P)-dependent dehydrogenase (short-subunit alcohol dehydrogenase family) [Povalibacter uvarum]
MLDPRTYKPATDALRDRVVLITGASDGIGRSVARAAAAHGAQVVLHGRNVKRLEAVYDSIVAANGPRPSILPLDLEKAGPAEYDALVAAMEKEFGRLDVLLHNAGMLGERAPVEHYEVAKWMRTMHVNANVPFVLTQKCLPLLRRSPDASIVFTSSGVVPRPRAFWGAYLASKWASEGLMRMLADELEQPGIRVNSINPGKVRTNMRLQAYPAEDRATLADPDAIVAAYLYLFGPDSRGISGQSFDAQ